MRYVQHEPDDHGWSMWVRPVEAGYRLSCCDCQLVHEMDFRVTDDGRAEFRARRHTRATAQKRVWAKRRGKSVEVPA